MEADPVIVFLGGVLVGVIVTGLVMYFRASYRDRRRDRGYRQYIVRERWERPAWNDSNHRRGEGQSWWPFSRLFRKNRIDREITRYRVPSDLHKDAWHSISRGERRAVYSPDKPSFKDSLRNLFRKNNRW